MRLALKIPYHKVGFLVNKYNPKRGDTSMFVKDLKEIEKSLEYFFSLANVASKPIELLNVTTELVKNKITRYE
jgi:hypothetical protein